MTAASNERLSIWLQEWVVVSRQPALIQDAEGTARWAKGEDILEERHSIRQCQCSAILTVVHRSKAKVL